MSRGKREKTGGGEAVANRQGRTRNVGFKIDEETAAFLDSLPNRSEYVRRAILQYLSRVCPLCDGAGAVPIGVHDHYAGRVDEHRTVHCVGCGMAERMPAADEPVSRAWRAFFRDGVLRCDGCRAGQRG